ncbi:MAG: cob(I)yrinic acid a,c-diamide adenosyltransferase [Nitrospinota bacterium]
MINNKFGQVQIYTGDGKGKTTNKFGQVQIYTGDGKGKTTAATGIAVRAIGRGCKVFFGQFLKDGNSGEILALKKLAPDNFKHEAFGSGGFPCLGIEPPREADYIRAQNGLARIKESLRSGEYQMVIADEINVAIKCGLIMVYDLINIIEENRLTSELILTGRSLHPELAKTADLITEFRAIKHYYEKGVLAREGIEI